MNEHSENTGIKVVAIDLAKNSFQLHGVDETGHKVMGKKFTRDPLKVCMAKLVPCLVVMESCIGAHWWGRLFQSYGHEVKLSAPQFVKLRLSVVVHRMVASSCSTKSPLPI